jgi:hypothetical protein
MSSSANDQNGNVIHIRKRKSSVSAPRAESARYIAQMTQELEQLANTSGLEMVGYFLAMARAEAFNAAEKASPQLAPATPQAPYRSD